MKVKIESQFKLKITGFLTQLDNNETIKLENTN
jgi:hypothetical protein